MPAEMRRMIALGAIALGAVIAIAATRRQLAAMRADAAAAAVGDLLTGAAAGAAGPDTALATQTDPPAPPPAPPPGPAAAAT